MKDLDLFYSKVNFNSLGTWMGKAEKLVFLLLLYSRCGKEVNSITYECYRSRSFSAKVTGDLNLLSFSLKKIFRKKETQKTTRLYDGIFDMKPAWDAKK